LFLPLGISFFTFQAIAYVVDVYRGSCSAVRDPIKMALFKAFFPQLIAGPIVRTPEFLPQLESARLFSTKQFLRGLDLIAVGVFKKVVVADQMSPFVDSVFAAPTGIGAPAAWLGVWGYAIEIYCDFSGYTDIGRGCAMCLGYELPKNFQFPYLSVNIIDFWRRWHITLSNWLRDYLYVPLGGNRRGRTRTYWNLIITMTLGGLWHGASWNFVAWGLYHGLLLTLTRWIHERCCVPVVRPLFAGRTYRIIAVILTFHLVCLGWVLFRAPTFDVAATVFSELLNIHFDGLAGMGKTSLFIMGLAVIACSCMHVIANVWLSRENPSKGRLLSLARPFLYFLVFVGVILCGGRGAQQFIYFQF
jgi:alginate O-acetyltransferase complex protein AlgI